MAHSREGSPWRPWESSSSGQGKDVHLLCTLINSISPTQPRMLGKAEDAYGKRREGDSPPESIHTSLLCRTGAPREGDLRFGPR